MTITSRKPSGLPAFPITLLAGMPSTGKSRLGAQASSSPLLSATSWLSYGELDPDEFGSLPWANFDLIDHDGTVNGIIEKLEEIVSEEKLGDEPTLIVLDSITPLWSTIGGDVRETKKGRTGADTDSDLWVDGKGDWQRVLNALRRHNGPSIITARLEESVVHVDGRPTRERAYRIKAERDLAYDVDVVIEMRAVGDYTLTKATPLALGFTGPRQLGVDFTIDQLWHDAGLDGDIGPRRYTAPAVQSTDQRDVSGRDWLDELSKALSASAVAQLGREATTAHAPEAIKAAIRKRSSALTATPATEAG